MIESGEHDKAQQAARVSMSQGVEGFSGFITVDKTNEANLFFWMFKPLDRHVDWEKAPVIIWLQGGPGASSLFGLFTEIGPFFVSEALVPTRRKYAWCQNYNLLFIDNPVGAGFSFATKEAGYTKTGDDVTRHLYLFLLQFYRMFPQLAGNRLFLMGQSYAGKFIPELAKFIHERNVEFLNHKKELSKHGKGSSKQSFFNKGSSKHSKESTDIKGDIVIRLEAIAIGNGLIDPYHMMHYSDYMYQLGMIDDNGRTELQGLESETRKNIKNKMYTKAVNHWYLIMKKILDWAKLKESYNFVHDTNDSMAWQKYLEKATTRKLIHAGNQTFHYINKEVPKRMKDDIMRSAKPAIEFLLKNEVCDVVIYSGQLDVLCAYPLTVNVFQKLEWQHADDYKKAERCYLEMDGDVVAYRKSAGRFIEILFRGCGHMVPADCPKVASRFLDVFVNQRRNLKCSNGAEESDSDDDD
ncbi:unnamed protein product [Bemisia tabaci]|uniref:Serine carboxypeptidase CPVL n=1 Tax=Bemisia tabaci TaxID=7038 RepID=A0A9P0F706_BEMTA|nr:unnamed protein product [Bemisia tabaci]